MGGIAGLVGSRQKQQIRWYVCILLHLSTVAILSVLDSVDQVLAVCEPYFFEPVGGGCHIAFD